MFLYGQLQEVKDHADARQASIQTLWLAGVESGKLTTLASLPREADSISKESLQRGPVWSLGCSGIAWSPNGRTIGLTADRITIEKDKRVSQEHALFLDRDGRQTAAFPVPDGFRSSQLPVISPDSKRAAIAVGSLKEPLVNILVFDLDAGTVKTCSTRTYNDLARWTADGKNLQYWSLAAGPDGKSRFELRQIDLQTDSDTLVCKPAARRAALSPDGRWRAMPSGDGLVVEDQQTGQSKILVKTPWPGVAGWSPDSRIILYVEPMSLTDQNRLRTDDIRVLWAVNAEPHKLNTMLISLDVDTTVLPSWSADCARLAFVSRGKLHVAQSARRPALPEEKLAAGLKAAEEEEKALIVKNAKAISAAVAQFILDQSRLPKSLDEMYA